MKTKRKVTAALRRETAFMEALARRLPQDTDVLKALGDLYTRTGRYAEGLQTDLELARLCPRESLVWYNLACSYALLNLSEDALAALERSIVLGYRDARWISADRDLDSIKKDKRFVALLQRIAL